MSEPPWTTNARKRAEKAALDRGGIATAEELAVLIGAPLEETEDALRKMQAEGMVESIAVEPKRKPKRKHGTAR